MTLLFLNAVVLYALHVVFHVAEAVVGVNALTTLYGPTDVGRALHAVTEAVVGVALVAALVVGVRRRQSF